MKRTLVMRCLGLWRSRVVLVFIPVIIVLEGCAFHSSGGKARPEIRYGVYAGEYQMQTNVGMIIRPDRDRLMAKVAGQDYFQLFPSGNDEFVFKVVDARIQFARSHGGAVTGFALHQDGKNYHFDRTSPTVPDDGSKRINAGGYRVRMIVKGNGTPTVVFEAGLGESLDGWGKVFPAVSGFVRAVEYDRSGLGLSERAGSPRTAGHVAQDLHRALRNAQIKPPYVLVGNSAGGLYSRVFARLFPKEVAGLALVEPSSEEYEQWLHQNHPEAFATAKDELKTATEGFRDHVAGWKVALEEAFAAWPLPAVPVVVLTGIRCEPDEAEKKQMWLTMHRRLVERIPGARHIVSSRSGHGLASEEPELVVRAVGELVDEIRKRQR